MQQVKNLLISWLYLMILMQSYLLIKQLNGVTKMYKNMLLAIDGSEHSKRAQGMKQSKLHLYVNECNIELVYVADFTKQKMKFYILRIGKS